MVPESMKSKKTKDYTNPIHRNSMDVTSPWVHDKYEGYSPSYDPRSSQVHRYKQKKPYNDLTLVVNSKPFNISNFEAMDKKMFSMKVSDYLNKLRLDEETYLITKIKILNELSKHKSRHFDNKEYEELLVRFLDLNEKV